MQLNLSNITHKYDQLRYNFLLFLICSIPLFYILGSFYINFILLVCVFCLFFFPKNQLRNYLKNSTIFICILVFFLLINSLLSVDKIYTFYKSFGYIRFLLYALFILITFDLLKKENLKWIGLFLLIFNIFVALDTIYQFIFDIDLLGNAVNYKHAYGRLSGPFGTEYIVGIYLFCFGTASIFFINKFFNVNKFINFFLFLFFFITIFLTGERNAFLTVLIFLFFLFLINKNTRFLILSTFICLIISCYVIISSSNILKNKYNFLNLPTFSSSDIQATKSNNLEKNSNIKNSIKLNNEKNENENKFNNFSYKIEKIKIIFLNNLWFAHYRAGFFIFKDNIFIGTGVKSFREECLNVMNYDGVVCTTHPHNMYVELLSDTGLIGLTIFIFSLYKIIKIFIKKKFYNNFAYSIILAMNFSFIFPFKPHGSFFTTNNAFLFWYIFSILIWVIFSKKNET